MRNVHNVKFIFTGLVSTLLLFLISPMLDASFRIAFLEAEDKIPIEDESEYKWAKENYSAVLIHPASAGKFKDDKGNPVRLEDFHVVWWHRANAPTIPSIFLDKVTMDAFLNFVKNGGSLFLTQVAFHYIYDLGLESVEPRLCGPNVDHAISGIIATPGQEGHPVYDGFKKMGDDPAKGFNIDCYGHDSMSDFYPKGPPKDITSVGMAYQEPHPQPWFGQVHPLCECRLGNGIIMISGWRFTVFRSGNEGCKHHDRMVKLHENILAYLGTLANVNIKGKLPATWGLIKNTY